LIRRNNQKSHDAQKKSRFQDEVGERYGKLSIGVVKFYNDGAL